jgi:alginate O-acetyltransferase complex protein AlgJ
LIRQILPPEGPAALLEDDSYDTVVVGTSNVQPRFGFQPVLSNQLVRPVGLSWRPNNVGPYFALLEYLRSDSFKRQRPRALVWNHLEQDMVNKTSTSAWGNGAMPPAEFISQLRRALA